MAPLVAPLEEQDLQSAQLERQQRRNPAVEPEAAETRVHSWWRSASREAPPRGSRHAASATPANPRSRPAETGQGRGVRGREAARLPGDSPGRGSVHRPAPKMKG